MSEGDKGARGETYRRSKNSQSRTKGGRRRGEGCISPENISNLRDKEGKRGQAIFSRQQNFLWQLMAASQALFFCFRFRKSWLVAWSTSFQCRLPAPERGYVTVAARG